MLAQITRRDTDLALVNSALCSMYAALGALGMYRKLLRDFADVSARNFGLVFIWGRCVNHDTNIDPHTVQRRTES